jgi:hypothetical protein
MADVAYYALVGSRVAVEAFAIALIGIHRTTLLVFEKTAVEAPRKVLRVANLIGYRRVEILLIDIISYRFISCRLMFRLIPLAVSTKDALRYASCFRRQHLREPPHSFALLATS